MIVVLGECMGIFKLPRLSTMPLFISIFFNSVSSGYRKMHLYARSNWSNMWILRKWILELYRLWLQKYFFIKIQMQRFWDLIKYLLWILFLLFILPLFIAFFIYITIIVILLIIIFLIIIIYIIAKLIRHQIIHYHYLIIILIIAIIFTQLSSYI